MIRRSALLWPMVGLALACCAGTAFARRSSEPNLPPDIPAPQRALNELKALDDAELLPRLQSLVGTEPLALSLAEVAIDPALIEDRKTEIESRVGADYFPEFAILAGRLHIQALKNASTMAGLRSIAGKADPEKLPALDFDGRGTDLRPFEIAPSASEVPATLQPAIVEPVARAGRERLVHTLAFQNGCFLVNGKPADPLADRQFEQGAGSEFLVHPEDPNVLVRLYHSPSSLAGFERKRAKIDSLRMLAAAGAAPTLLEHGEAIVPGMGRTYFYVQEIVQDGYKLGSAAAESEPIEEVLRLFQKLMDAGLALQVPGLDSSWLLSHIMIGKTAGSGFGAYLLGGSVLRMQPEKLAEHYEMLRSMLIPKKSPNRRRLEITSVPSLKKGSTRPSVATDKLATHASQTDILIVTHAPGRSFPPIIGRHHLAYSSYVGQSGSKGFYLGSSSEVIDKVPALLGDSEVDRVKVHPTLYPFARNHAEGAGAGSFYEILKHIRDPHAQWRDALILGIPASAYSEMDGRDIAAILSLISLDSSRQDTWAKIPAEAWLKMSFQDMYWLAESWAAIPQLQWTASYVACSWMRSNADLPGATGKNVLDLLGKLTPSFEARNLAILAIPGSFYTRLDSADIRAILAYLNPLNAAQSQQIPEAAWRGMSLQDARNLMARSNASDRNLILQRWMDVQDYDPSGKKALEIRDMLLSMPESGTRDDLIGRVPGSAYQTLKSEDIVSILNLYNQMGGSDSDRAFWAVPVEAWRGLNRSDMEQLKQSWADSGFPRAAEGLLRRWTAAQSAPMSAVQTR